jgi:lysine-N-methylase
MAWPIRHLPVLQNWDCHGCTSCCREYRVYLSDEEAERITKQDWRQEADLVGVPAVVSEGPGWSRRRRLNQRPDGCCIFLGAQGRCRIHERFGSDAKPFACRLYPFILVPAGDHWRVGLRFSCPSAAQNHGKPLAEHETELRTSAAEMERQEKVGEQTLPPPLLQSGQRVEWPDLLLFLDTLVSILKNPADSLGRRWRKCLALARLCRQARFENVTGPRLEEFLHVVAEGLETEVPVASADVEPPSRIGRILFRQALAVLIRKDVGPDRGPATRGRLALLTSALKFARGQGPIPRLHKLLPDTTFDALEQPIGPLPEVAQEILERYYLVKLVSLQFCGPANFGLPFWAGLESLALTLPALLWLVRAFADLPREAAAIRAIAIVDHNFAYSSHLGGRWQRFSQRILASRGELEKLIGWYSR